MGEKRLLDEGQAYVGALALSSKVGRTPKELCPGGGVEVAQPVLCLVAHLGGPIELQRDPKGIHCGDVRLCAGDGRGAGSDPRLGPDLQGAKPLVGLHGCGISLRRCAGGGDPPLDLAFRLRSALPVGRDLGRRGVRFGAENLSESRVHLVRFAGHESPTCGLGEKGVLQLRGTEVGRAHQLMTLQVMQFPSKARRHETGCGGELAGRQRAVGDSQHTGERPGRVGDPGESPIEEVAQDAGKGASSSSCVESCSVKRGCPLVRRYTRAAMPSWLSTPSRPSC